MLDGSFCRGAATPLPNHTLTGNGQKKICETCMVAGALVRQLKGKQSNLWPELSVNPLKGMRPIVNNGKLEKADIPASSKVTLRSES